MMSQVENHTDFPNYTRDKVVKIAGVMARYLEYNIDAVKYGFFHDYISACTELPFFSKAGTARNATDQGWPWPSGPLSGSQSRGEMGACA